MTQCTLDNLSAKDRTAFTAIKRGRKIQGEYVGVEILRDQAIDDMIVAAKADVSAVISEVHKNYPDLINKKGEFLSDLSALERSRAAKKPKVVSAPKVKAKVKLTAEAAQFLEAAKQGMPGSITNNLQRIAKENGVTVTKSMTPADVIAALEAIANETKKETKARSPEPSPAPVVREEQPASPSKAGAGTTAVKDAGKSKQKGGSKDKPKKLSNAEKSESTERGKSEPAEREEQQPTDITLVSKKRAKDFAETGNYDIVLSNDTTFKIFRDTAQFGYPVWWSGDTNLGSTMDEAVQRLIDGANEVETKTEPTVAPVTHASAKHAWNALRVEATLDPATRNFVSVLSWENLPAGAKKEWTTLFDGGKYTVADMDRIYEEVFDDEYGPAILDTAKALVEDPGSTKGEFGEGVSLLLAATVFSDASKGSKQNAWLKEAWIIVDDTLGNSPLYSTPDHTAWTHAAFLNNAVKFLEPKVKESAKGDTGRVENPSFTTGKNERPWAEYAYDNNILLDVVHNVYKAGHVIEKPSKRISKVLTTITETQASTVEQAVKETDLRLKRLSQRTEEHKAATSTLVEMLRIIISGKVDGEMSPMLERSYISRAKQLIEEGASMEYVFEGAPLSEWLPNGELQWEKGKLKRPALADTSVEEQLNEMDAKPIEGRNSNLEDGSVVTKPITYLAAKIYISKIIKKLNAKYAPRIRHYADLAEFKKTALYKEALASRKDGANIITDLTAAHSFGNTVVIFRNNIKNKSHLAFVVGHEVLGHFGLASVMPQANLKKLMRTIYDTDPHVQAEANRRMELYSGMTQTEATEEALADLAGEVESSTINRVWAAFKNFLNKLGIKFSDDMARYYISQSRRMLRTGNTGGVSANAIYNDLMDIQKRYIEGRNSDNLASVRAIVPTPMNGATILEGTWDTIKTVGGDMTSIEGLDTNVRKLADSSTYTWESAKRGLELIQTLDQKALRSLGLRKIFDIFQKHTEHVRKLQSILNDKTKFSHKQNWFNKAAKSDQDFDTGATREEKAHANQLLQEGRLYRMEQVEKAGEQLIHNQADIIEISDDGLTVKRNEANIIKLREAGAVSREEFEDGIKTIKYNDAGEVEKGSKPHKYKSEPISDRVWALYEEQRDAVNEAAVMVYEDKIKGMIGSKELELNYLQGQHGFNDDTKDILRWVTAEYSRLYDEGGQLVGKGFKWKDESITKANAFIHQVTRVMDKDGGTAKMKDWVDGSTLDDDKHLEQFRNNPALLEKLETLAETRIENVMSMRNTLMDMHLLDTQLTNAKYAAVNSVLAGYVPFARRGNHQVRVQAYDKDGKAIHLDEHVQAMLFYTRTDSRKKADVIRDELNAKFAEFGDSEISVFTGARDKDGKAIPVKLSGVTFRADSGAASQVPPLGSSLNYDDMANTLMRAGIKLREQDRESLVRMTTKQHSTARGKLRLSGNPGWDQNIMRGVAEHLEMQTHVAGKNRYKHNIAHILSDKVSDGSVWFGDKVRLAKLQKAFLTASPEKKDAARKAMTEYQHMFIHSSSDENISVVDYHGERSTVSGKGNGNRYRDDAANLVEYYNRNVNIDDATGEGMVNKMAGPLMSWTAAMQIGGSVVSAGINTTSLVSHAGLYLSTYNKKTGYGGGHGMMRSYNAIWQAGRDLSLFKDGFKQDVAGNVTLLKELIAPTWKVGERRNGMLKDEAEAVLAATEKGVLTPNMHNALVGTSRTGKQDSKKDKAIEVWMSMFSKTEQYNRRVTFLASYRLEKARMIEQGTDGSSFNSATSNASKDVYQRSVLAVNSSQGNYSQFNRPAIARGNFAQYLYMYKQFVVITVQLMRNMGRTEQLYFLAFLVLTSGLKGIPFSEDFMDLVDSLMQMFDVKWEGLETYIARGADAIVPGSSRVVLRGFLDYFTGGTVSTRLGHGNIVPGTSYFLAGADTAREAMDVLGPVASAMKGASDSAVLAARYVGETVGIFDDTTTLKDVARSGGGFSALKAVAEGAIFMSDGSITNKRGQVVSGDFTPVEMIARMIGFYPSSATAQYDANRRTERMRGYIDERKAHYIQAYRKAGSSAERTRIVKMVQDWNRDARGTPFVITNFVTSANKSRKEAQRSASGRLLKSAPKTLRDFHKEQMRLQGVN